MSEPRFAHVSFETYNEEFELCARQIQAFVDALATQTDVDLILTGQYEHNYAIRRGGALEWVSPLLVEHS